MRGLIKTIRISVVVATLVVAFYPRITSTASAVPTGTILIGQIKITSSNGQFVSLYNNTATEIDMSTVQLAYYNYYDLTSSKLTSSRFISLSGKLAPRSYYMVSDGLLTLCYKMMVNTQSLGFSSTAGTLQITQNGPSTVLDSVAWSKTAVTVPTQVQTLPTQTNGFLQRAWLEGIPKTVIDPWISAAPTVIDGCELQTQLAAAPPLLITTSAVPQVIKTVATPKVIDDLATKNLGLVAPSITELFPNPQAPQTDDNDEFIELYNPNTSVYDLTGYRIEVGTSYSRGFTFTVGPLALLQPKTYTVFKITDTNLQLSNSEGQARLVDSDKATISETPAYEDAPEGESWSHISDSWQWSDVPTPYSVNLPSKVAEATPQKSATKTTASTTKTTKPTTTKKSSAGKVAGANTTTPAKNNAAVLNDVAPLHPLALVGVGVAAVGYAVYEYRKDMANTIFRLKRYVRRRRTAR